MKLTGSKLKKIPEPQKLLPKATVEVSLNRLERKLQKHQEERLH